MEKMLKGLIPQSCGCPHICYGSVKNMFNLFTYLLGQTRQNTHMAHLQTQELPSPKIPLYFRSCFLISFTILLAQFSLNLVNKCFQQDRPQFQTSGLSNQHLRPIQVIVLRCTAPVQHNVQDFSGPCVYTLNVLPVFFACTVLQQQPLSKICDCPQHTPVVLYQ